MPLTPNPQETDEMILSLKKYIAAEFDQEMGDLKAKAFLGYILQDIAPFAYNEGVKHAEEYFRNKLEDLSATCFEPTMTYWHQKRKR